MGFTKKELEKRFPNLARELDKNAVSIPITSVRSDTSAMERTPSKRGTSYNPDVIDFIRRCNRKEEAKEIIDFMEKRGEISHEYANKLRDQLSKKGVRSFGPKKRDDYYFHYFGYKDAETEKL